jgi:folate-binding protein YgfZ
MIEAPPPPVRQSPLGKLHRQWGARFAAIDGAEVPMAYAAVEEEHAALRDGCALIDRSHLARWELVGEDRHRFLNGLVTCEVKDLVAGHGAYGYFTDRQGKILADVVVLALDDRLWLELPAVAGEAIRAHLEKYIIADRVEVRSLDDLVLWTLAGGRTRELLGGFTARPLPEAPWSHGRIAVAGSEVQVVRQGRMGVEAWTLWTSASLGRPLAASLREGGATPVGHEALEIVRVEQGIGKFGRDFGPQNLPQEVGEPVAVSYTKGCYLGQEIVARIHYRGGVNHRLTRLAFASSPAPAAGTPVLHEAHEVGRLTSAVTSPREGPIGIAMLHKRAWEAESLNVGGALARPRPA